ncbi:MAG: manganese efflux pump [Anaerolineae bacterium]|nr:manganese efflux pump [Anaerolineae bacterium]
MEIGTSLIIATSLAMDAFAVSLGIGTTRKAEDFRSRFRLAFHFGIFQGLMTVIGWLAGSTIAGYISNFDHWVAMALLAYVGVNMVRSGLNPDQDSYKENPSRGRTLMVLCVATSLDAMAVGLSMAMIGTSVTGPALVIGLVTLALSAFGLGVGGKLGEKFGKRMEILGGILLIGIGLRIVLTHIL